MHRRPRQCSSRERAAWGRSRQKKRAVIATKTAGARIAKPEDPVPHDIRKYATWPQQDDQPEGYRRRLLDSDDEDELATLPVNQRAVARSAKVIRRYVPAAAPERTAPPPEDPKRMQAWLGRVIPVPAHPLQAQSSQACPELHMVFVEAQLYTDGSTITEGKIGEFLRGKETTRSTGAIVGTDDGDTYNATRLDFASSKLTSFLTELTTLMYARLRSNSNIASDCQGAIKTLQRAKSGRRPKGIQGHITAKYTLQSVRERTEAF